MSGGAAIRVPRELGSSHGAQKKDRVLRATGRDSPGQRRGIKVVRAARPSCPATSSSGRWAPGCTPAANVEMGRDFTLYAVRAGDGVKYQKGPRRTALYVPRRPGPAAGAGFKAAIGPPSV